MAQHAPRRSAFLKILLSCSAFLVVCDPGAQALPGDYFQDNGQRNRPTSRNTQPVYAQPVFQGKVSKNQSPRRGAQVVPSRYSSGPVPTARARTAVPVATPVPTLAAEILHYGRTCGSNKENQAPGCRALANHLGRQIFAEKSYSAVKIDQYVTQTLRDATSSRQNQAPQLYYPDFYNEAIYRALSTMLSAWGQQVELNNNMLQDTDVRTKLTRFLDLYCDLFRAAWNQDKHTSISQETFADLTRDIVHMGMALQEGSQPPNLTEDTQEVFKKAQKIVPRFARGTQVILVRHWRDQNPKKYYDQIKDLADHGDLLAKLKLASYLYGENKLTESGKYYALAMNAISSHNNLESDSKSPRTMEHNEFSQANHKFQQERLRDLQTFLVSEEQKAKPGQPEFLWHYLLLKENLLNFKNYWEKLVQDYYKNFVAQLNSAKKDLENTLVNIEIRIKNAKAFYEKNQAAISEILRDNNAKWEVKKQVKEIMDSAKKYIGRKSLPTRQLNQDMPAVKGSPGSDVLLLESQESDEPKEENYPYLQITSGNESNSADDNLEFHDARTGEESWRITK